MSTFFPAHSPFDEQGAEFEDVRQAAALAASGQRLDRAAAEALYYKASLHTLAQLAHDRRGEGFQGNLFLFLSSNNRATSIRF